MHRVFFNLLLSNLSRSFWFVSLAFSGVLFSLVFVFRHYFDNAYLLLQFTIDFLDEEFIYFFDVLLVLSCSLILFQDTLNSLIESRSLAIFSQNNDLYLKNITILNALLVQERENLEFLKFFILNIGKLFFKIMFFFIFYFTTFYLKSILSFFLMNFENLIFLINKLYNTIYDKSFSFLSYNKFKHSFFSFFRFINRLFIRVLKRIKKG